MTKRSILPPDFLSACDQLKISPGLVSGDHVFLSGVTGSDSTGQMPDEPEIQIRGAFEKIGIVLREAGLNYGSIVEMTTYHIGLRDHFDLFNSIRLEYIEEPWPAWTAVEAAGLRREGAIVEIRVIASAEREA